MKYNITEIFYSLQGEGYWTGTPAIFIRFAGCNLACSWCDTNHESREHITQERLLERVQAFPCKHVILTGGEPTLQLTQKLIDDLHTVNKFLHLETNGVNPLEVTEIDWITVSPKSHDNNWSVQQGDELKIVYRGQSILPYQNSDFIHYFLQPCSMKNIDETIKKVKTCPKWRLSVQLHKILNIP